MSNVTLTVSGRQFTVACAEGEEAHIRKLGVVTTYGASWLRATLAGDPPKRLVTRAFRHAAKPDRLLYMALYDMNRADAARRAGYLARVEQGMRQF